MSGSATRYIRTATPKSQECSPDQPTRLVLPAPERRFGPSVGSRSFRTPRACTARKVSAEKYWEKNWGTWSAPLPTQATGLRVLGSPPPSVRALRQAVLCSSKGQVRRVDASSVLAGVSKRPLPRDRAMLHLPCDSVGQQGATSVLCPSTDRAIALCLGSCPCPAAFRCSCSHVHEAPEPRLQWYSWPHVQEPIELRQSAVISRQLGFVEPFSFPG